MVLFIVHIYNGLIFSKFVAIFHNFIIWIIICIEHPDVVSVFPNKLRKLHTTHSWDFLLLEKNGVIHSSSLWKKAKFGEGTIIANLDTGNFI